MPMKLQKPLHLLMRKLVVPVLVVDLAALAEPLPDRTLVVDVPEILAALTGDPHQPDRHPELDVPNSNLDLLPGGNLKNKDVDVDSSPSQSHTEDQEGTPLPSDTTPDKDRLNSKAD